MSMTFENRYSAIDRLVHRVAFASPAGQIAMAEIEDRMYATELETVEIDRPVFITALPRAGTTVLLELLASLDEFATHSYRNMPFVLCPLLWSRISAGFHGAGDRFERAHGDGVTISPDSPEAFEEMLWMAFETDARRDRIVPRAHVDEDFLAFMRMHMKKIVLLGGGGRRSRYLSKNNANVARVDLLAAEFDDAVLLVPFRDPFQHAASLRRQHRRFLDMHGRDDFARRYMAGIGHFDFGANFLPVDFDDWLARSEWRDPSTVEFWLEYWIAAYRHLGSRPAVSLVCFEDLCARPAVALHSIATHLEIEDRKTLVGQAGRLAPPRSHDIALAGSASPLAIEAKRLYASLRARSIVPQPV